MIVIRLRRPHARVRSDLRGVNVADLTWVMTSYMLCSGFFTIVSTHVCLLVHGASSVCLIPFGRTPVYVLERETLVCPRKRNCTVHHIHVQLKLCDTRTLHGHSSLFRTGEILRNTMHASLCYGHVSTS